jgi:hypothetical protein
MPRHALITLVFALAALPLIAQGGVSAVDVKNLQPLLPTLPGWTRGQPAGKQQDMPFPISEVSARYVKDKTNVTVDIMDATSNEMFMGPLAVAFSAGHVVTLNGMPVLEEWNASTKRGADTVIVARRFIVDIKGSDLDAVDVLHQFIDAMDLKKLAALK